MYSQHVARLEKILSTKSHTNFGPSAATNGFNSVTKNKNKMKNTKNNNANKTMIQIDNNKSHDNERASSIIQRRHSNLNHWNNDTTNTRFPS
jgi:hypothetical protein